MGEQKKEHKFINLQFSIQIRLFVLKLIRLYQRTLSPDHGLFSKTTFYGCKYHPTCSDYSYQAIEKYGVLKGGRKAIWRILRCNPFSRGGNDPLK